MYNVFDLVTIIVTLDTWVLVVVTVAHVNFSYTKITEIIDL